MIAHRQQSPRPVRESAPDVPADLEAVVLRCLEKSPADRYPDVRSLDDALAHCACAGRWSGEAAMAWWRGRA